MQRVAEQLNLLDWFPEEPVHDQTVPDISSPPAPQQTVRFVPTDSDADARLESVDSALTGSKILGSSETMADSSAPGTPVETMSVQLMSQMGLVAALGECSADIEALTDDALVEGQRVEAEARRLLNTYSAWLAASLAHRSRRELGHSGLAAQQGFVSAEAMIQKLTGSSRTDATKMVTVGTMMAETEAADQHNQTTATTDDGGTDSSLDGADPDGSVDGTDPDDGRVEVPWQAPISRAVIAGTLSVDKAESIRRGLGDIDTAVTAEKLRNALTLLLDTARTLNADPTFKLARRMRNELDHAGIAAREKEARDDEYLKIWRQHDGMVRINGLLAGENGAFITSLFDCITSPRRGGPRHAGKKQTDWAEKLRDDARTTEQITADAFVQLLRNGSETEPGTILGARKPAVRILITETTLTNQNGHGYIEGDPTPISWNTIERNLCTSGTQGIKFDDDGQCVNVGRTQRLFTEKQRDGITARDCGCLWPDCDRPPLLVRNPPHQPMVTRPRPNRHRRRHLPLSLPPHAPPQQQLEHQTRPRNLLAPTPHHCGRHPNTHPNAQQKPPHTRTIRSPTQRAGPSASEWLIQHSSRLRDRQAQGTDRLRDRRSPRRQ